MLRFAGVVVALVTLGLWTPSRAAPPPVEAYGKLPGVEQITLSPSGQRYAFITVVGDTRKLVASTADGITPLYAINVGSTKVVNLRWAGEDHLLVEILSTESLGVGFLVHKAEFETVVAINLRTRKAVAIFDHHPEVPPTVSGVYGVTQEGGRWYGYFGGITLAGGAGRDPVLTHTWPDLYRVDLDTGDMHIAAHSDGDTGDWLVGPDGAVIARVVEVNPAGGWQVRSGGFNGKVLASGQSKISGAGDLSRGRSPDTVVMSRADGDHNVYQEVKLFGGGAASPPEPEVEGVLTDPVTHLWIGSHIRGDQTEDRFFAPELEARMKGVMKAFPDLLVELQSYTPDLGRMIVETTGSGDSGTFWLVDISTGKADPIGYAYPAVSPADVGTIEMVDWKAADGLELHGVLNLPPGRPARDLPVIVMPHGGPEDRDYPTFWWWSQLFASRGYAVFQPNFRGSSGYGDAFRDAGFGQWGRKMQTDVSDGLAALVSRGIVDPKRACIVGWSYGGYAAEAGVTVQHGIYRCAVSMAGVSDLAGLLDYARDRRGGEEGTAERYWKAFMGVTGDWSSVLNPISPIKRAGEADAPILLIHGKDDTVVPVGQSLEMARALKAAGKPMELVTLPNADHWLLHEDTRLAMARASLDFVLKHNPPDPDPDPDPEPAPAAKP